MEEGPDYFTLPPTNDPLKDYLFPVNASYEGRELCGSSNLRFLSNLRTHAWACVGAESVSEPLEPLILWGIGFNKDESDLYTLLKNERLLRDRFITESITHPMMDALRAIKPVAVGKKEQQRQEEEAEREKLNRWLAERHRLEDKAAAQKREAERLAAQEAREAEQQARHAAQLAAQQAQEARWRAEAQAGRNELANRPPQNDGPQPDNADFVNQDHNG